MKKLTLRELLASYIIVHLDTSDDGLTIKNTKKNEWIFKAASKIMGGRDKLDNTAKKVVRILIENGIIDISELSEEQLMELNTEIK